MEKNVTLRLQYHLDKVAVALKDIEPSQRAGWITWLFEALEEETKDGDYSIETTMQEVIDALEERMDEGFW